MRGFVFAGMFVWCLSITWPNLSAAESPASIAGYRAGLAQIDITPDYPVRLSGFGFRRTESAGVTQHIWTKALAIQPESGDVAILVTTDNLGVPWSVTAEVADRLNKKVGLPRDRLTITSTHTHTAPMLRNVAPTLFSLPITPEHQASIDRYTRELTDKIEQVSLDAIKDLASSQLSWGVGSVKFAINRRTRGGPVDHDLPILVVKNIAGQIRGIYANYACHCVTLSNNQVSGDWAGYAQDLIQREFPNSIALMSVGCGADLNPNSGVTGDKVAVAESQGMEIATEIKRLTNGFLVPLEGPLTTQSQTISLKFATPPTREQFAERVKQGGYIGYHAQVQLERLNRGESLQTTLDYPIQTWSFGDRLAMVFLPGEVVVDYSLRLKRELDGQRLWVTAYANDVPCYIPSERILKEGGYEGGEAMTYYDRPSRFEAGLEQQIVNAVAGQIGKSFAPSFDAAKTMGTLPKSPLQTLATLRTAPQFRADLVVAEPLIADPVAIDFGWDGDLWVAEMHDYPAGVSGDFQPGGRVRLVEDKDGDGRYESSSVFLDQIPFPTGVTVWRDGVLVCAAPDILFARDTNGDGRADEVKTLYTGFGTGNYQARVNSLSYGLDGWVYGSCGLFGGTIKNFKGQEFALGDRDFRIKPDTGELEAATGRTQQGRVRDDWDNWFGCDNSNLCRHYPLADHYLRRNPHLVPPSSFVNVSTGENANRLFPATAQVQRFKLSGPENNVTAACGLGIYRDTLLGADFQGNAFTCEPVNLLVHRLQLSPSGSSFVGRRAPDEANSEFFAGTDDWFRPVQAKTGPDGGLWVVDMYRFVIEHPRWIPAETVAQLDVRAGHGMGRVYRVLPRDAKSLTSPRLNQMTGLELVAALDTDNGWQRDLASQMLDWKFGSSGASKSEVELRPIVEALTHTATKSTRVVARLQALCLLNVLDQLSPEVNLLALADARPEVRRHAVRIAERNAVKHPKLATGIAALIDTDAQVSLQQAYSLASLPDRESGLRLYQLAEVHCQDEQILSAVTSSLRKENVGPFLEAAVRDSEVKLFHKIVLPRAVGQSIALRSTQALPQVIQFFTTKQDLGWQAWQFEGIAEILASVQRQGTTITELGDPQSAKALNDLLAKTLELLKDEATPQDLRISILQVLGRDQAQHEVELSVLSELLKPQTDPELQSRVIETLGRMNLPQVPTILVRNWASHSPTRQTQILDLLLSRPKWTAELLTFVAEKQIGANQIDAVRRQRLLMHANADLRVRAEKLLAGATNPDRVKVLETYATAAKLTGDIERGRTLFTKTCATCHQLGAIGQAVGPDLAALANKSPQFLLQEILDPNRNVDSRFVQYTVVLTDGRIHTGLLATESANSITLKTAEGKAVDILRADLDEIASTGESLMPEGLERDLPPQSVADIMAFITHSPAPFKPFPGNRPRLVAPVNDRLELVAAAAEIRGESVVFEEPFQNIGYWHGLQDHVTWTAKLEQPGEYDVYLDFSCAPDSAGNEFVFTGGNEPLIAQVPPTGGWDRYQRLKVGTVVLTAGTGRLALRPSGPQIRGALMDLKAVLLLPKGAVLAAVDAPPEPTDPKKIAEIAAQILDDKIPQDKRQALITQHPKLASQLIQAMTEALTSGTPEEYRRIPWIWRVAIATGKRNDADEIRAVLEVSIPQPNLPLHDWRAVVIGGGIINGISQEGVWPGARLAEILKDQTALQTRWQMSLDEAAKMAEDPKVPTGTRYDALRMIALDRWERREAYLVKYLAAGSNPELQMGAVSGLVDVDQPAATAHLIKSLNHLVPQNRTLALDGLFRGETRQKALLEALELKTAQVVWLSAEQKTKLLNIGDATWRDRAMQVLK